VSTTEPERAPQLTARHNALSIFLGEWSAEGWSYGNPNQSATEPTAIRDRWNSTHTARFHTGDFFLIQDERATIGPNAVPFDTISIMGVDPATGNFFAHTVENHGYFRRYDVTVEGLVWTFDGAAERARVVFSEDRRKQTITWEWKKAGKWLPLCDRIGTKQQ
jgi:hypothetical protein